MHPRGAFYPVSAPKRLEISYIGQSMGRKQRYHTLFSEKNAPQPPADLAKKTLLAISMRERRILIAKLLGLGIMFAASLAIAVTELTATSSAMGQSGFLQFASLFFSDFGSAIGNFPDIFMSLLESFPIFSAGIALGGLTVAVWSFLGFVDDANMLRGARTLSLK